MWYKVNLDLKLCKCSLCKLQELWRWKWGIKMLLCMKKQRGNFRFPFATSAVVSPGTLLTHALPAWEALRFSMGASWEMTWSTVCDAGQGSGADLYFLQNSGENPEPNAAAAQTDEPRADEGVCHQAIPHSVMLLSILISGTRSLWVRNRPGEEWICVVNHSAEMHK